MPTELTVDNDSWLTVFNLESFAHGTSAMLYDSHTQTDSKLLSCFQYFSKMYGSTC